MENYTEEELKRFLRIMEYEHDPIGEHITNSFSSPHPPNGMIYHYTSTEGLKGILESEFLRATRITCLNDVSEMHYGVKMLKSALSTFSQKIDEQIAARILPLPETIAGIGLQFMNETWNPPREYDVYTISFCHEGNLDELWHRYGNHGQGYSIGFSSHHLARAAEYFKFTKVIYNEEKQREIISQAIHIALNWFTEIFSNSNLHPYAIPEWIREKFYHSLLPMLPFYKLNKWHVEQEWRIAIPSHGMYGQRKIRGDEGEDTPYEFRIISNILPKRIPYFLPTKEIIAGFHISENELQVAKYIAIQKGYGDITFKRSQASLRS